MFGLTKPSLALRVAIGKLVGFVIGLVAFIALPTFYPEAGMHIRVGILLWYTTIGAIVGFAGVFTENPVVKFPLPWWFRGIIFGGWMNFLLALIAYDQIQTILSGAGFFGIISPFWAIIEGAIVGLVADWFATKYGGEGSETVS